MATLMLVRHVQTTAAPGVCYGITDVGVPADATQALAQRIAPQVRVGTAVRCSPLRRCAELAKAIEALRPELVASIDPRLIEMDFGAWEGREWASIAQAEIDGWTGHFADGRPGGTGESTRRLMQRVGQAFDEWQQSGRDALWLTHAGVIRAVQLLHRGVRSIERADQWPAAPIAFGECIVVES